MQKAFERLYYLSVLLILLPTIYLIPIVPSTHTIAVIIWIILFFYVIIKEKSSIFGKNFLLLLFVILFLSQSLSIITALDIGSFASSYEKVLSVGLFLITSLFFISTKRDIEKLVKVLFVVTAINLFQELFIFLFPDLFLNIGQKILNKDYLSLIDINIQRGRVYAEEYNEILIPVIILYWTRKKDTKILLPLALGISAFSFLSLIRTKAVMFIFALVASVIIFFRRIKRYYFLLLSTLIILTFLFLISYNTNSYTVVDRLLLTYKTDQSTVSSRIDRWGISLDIGLFSPFFGVGLGNYYNYLPSYLQRSSSLNTLANQEFNIAAQDPHNIFFSTLAETGGIGLGVFIFIFLYFIKNDMGLLLKKNNELSKTFIVSFWTLFIYALFNPSDSITYLALFWLTRVLVYKTEKMDV